MQRLDIHAFAISQSAETMIRQALGDRRLSKASATFLAGDLLAAAAKYDSEASPDLLIVELGEISSGLFEHLSRLSDVCRAETDLILLGEPNDVVLYRALKQSGVHDYVPLAVDATHLTEAVLALPRLAGDRALGRVVAFMGATGGAGSSTVATNVAWQLGRLYQSEVTLVDLDLAFGTVGLDLNLESPQSTAQALAQTDRLDDQMLERFVAKYDDHLSLLSSAGDGGSTDVDVAALDRLLTAVRRNASWVVLDLPRCWGRAARHALETADEIVITAVPTLASLRNAKAAADALNPGRPAAPVRLVLNRIGAAPKTEIPVKDFAATFGGAPTARIPHDMSAFAEAATRGHIVAERTRSSRLRDPFRQLATAVSGRREPERRPRAAWTRFLPGGLAWAR